MLNELLLAGSGRDGRWSEGSSPFFYGVRVFPMKAVQTRLQVPPSASQLTRALSAAIR
jgi:hypothetical protein